VKDVYEYRYLRSRQTGKSGSETRPVGAQNQINTLPRPLYGEFTLFSVSLAKLFEYNLSTS
jgi:hypothetical protein